MADKPLDHIHFLAWLMFANLIAVGAYVALAALLLSLNLASRWTWWVKAGAIVATTGFFFVSYASMVSFFGWPSDSELPENFQVHWTRIVEPDKFTGADGAIYLWVETLDERNIPSGVPRAYELAYSEDLARRIRGVQESLVEGREQAGRREDVTEAREVDETLATEEQADPAMAHSDSAAHFDPDVQLDQAAITFHDLPPPVLPDKGPL